MESRKKIVISPMPTLNTKDIKFWNCEVSLTDFCVTCKPIIIKGGSDVNNERSNAFGLNKFKCSKHYYLEHSNKLFLNLRNRIGCTSSLNVLHWNSIICYIQYQCSFETTSLK